MRTSGLREIVCLVEDLNITQSGTYTIHIPEGFLTKGTKKSEAKQLTWTYTYKPSQSGGDDKELVVRSLTIAGTDLLTTRKLASLTPGEELAVNIDPIEEAEMVRVNITDDAGNTIRNIEICTEGPTKSDVVDRATGYYKTSVGGFDTEKNSSSGQSTPFRLPHTPRPMSAIPQTPYGVPSSISLRVHPSRTCSAT